MGMDIADASCYDGNCTEDSGTNSKFAENCKKKVFGSVVSSCPPLQMIQSMTEVGDGHWYWFAESPEEVKFHNAGQKCANGGLVLVRSLVGMNYLNQK